MMASRRMMILICGACVSVLLLGIYEMRTSSLPAPGTFDFEYFETLPESRILPEAQSFVAQNFPPGSNLENAIRAFTDAGAKCSQGTNPTIGPYHLCHYERRDHGVLRSIFITVEWKVVMRSNVDGKTFKTIEVNRGLTGL
jgi:hypothetical protein